MATDQPESLGTGLAKQISKISDVQTTVHNLYHELDGLLKRCEALKTECAQRTQDRSNLRSEIDKLQKERDCLRLEVRDSAQYHSPALTPTSASAPLGGFDQQGRLRRRIWSLEQDLSAANSKIAEETRKGQDAVTQEMAVAAGLRQRIGQLEERARKAEAQVKEGEERERKARKEWEVEMATKASQRAGLASELRDVKDALEKEKRLTTDLEQQVQKLQMEKSDLDKDLRARFESRPKTALQTLQPNVIVDRARTPASPSKRKAHGELDAFGATSPTTSPSKSLRSRLAHLEERHTLLKVEYDKLRGKYMEDLKHWKEYKAAETTRINLKRQRRAEKRQARGTTKSIDRTENMAHEAIADLSSKIEELVAASDMSQSLTQDREEDHETTDRQSARGDSPSAASDMGQKENAGRSPEGPVTRSQTRLSQQSKEHAPRSSQHMATPPRVHASDRQLERDLSTPSGQTSKQLRALGRVTPWLGSGAPGHSSKGREHEAHDEDAEDIFSDEQNPPGVAAPSAIRTPLIRDRGLAGTSSLRRSALQRIAAGAPAEHDDSTTPSIESKGGKRKLIDLEMLSPAQKAAELKRLSKMTSKEKREVYAEYKGKGRYVPPEEVRTGVYDDYEIDPDRNEGENYRFHDVKRQKAERRLMHGGDCECCKEYYDAIGPIPKYNQGPKWRDGPQNDEDSGSKNREAEMQEHQNKVSRHRETWRRPPTPPGYWEIGFPTTQAVAEQNARADEMVAKREAEVRREAAHRDSKWRRKG